MKKQKKADNLQFKETSPPTSSSSSSSSSSLQKRKAFKLTSPIVTDFSESSKISEDLISVTSDAGFKSKPTENHEEEQNVISSPVDSPRSEPQFEVSDNSFFYIDCVIIEATLPAQTDSAAATPQRGLFTTAKLQPFSVQKFQTPTSFEENPVWNCSLTFTVYVSKSHNESTQTLVLTMYSVKSSSTSDQKFLGRIDIDVFHSQILDFDIGEIVDTWIPIKGLQGTEEPDSQIHLILHKTQEPSKGLLSYYGSPLRCMPLRVIIIKQSYPLVFLTFYFIFLIIFCGQKLTDGCLFYLLFR